MAKTEWCFNELNYTFLKFKEIFSKKFIIFSVRVLLSRRTTSFVQKIDHVLFRFFIDVFLLPYLSKLISRQTDLSQFKMSAVVVAVAADDPVVVCYPKCRNLNLKWCCCCWKYCTFFGAAVDFLFYIEIGF